MNADATRLTGITRELWAQWQRTKNEWRDAKSQEFEKKYMAELRASVDQAVAIIEQLDKLVTKIRKDCE